MSVLDTLLQQAVQLQVAASEKEQLCDRLADLSRMLEAQGRPFDMDLIAGSKLQITIDLSEGPVPGCTPAMKVEAMTAPEPEPEPEPEPPVIAPEPVKGGGDVVPVDVEYDKDGYRVGLWMPDELEISHRMLDQRKTNGDVAKALGRKPSAVSVKMAQLRKKRGDAYPQGGVPDAQKIRLPGALADLSGPERAIEAHLTALGYVPPWNALHDYQLLSGLIGGKSPATLAASFDVSQQILAARLKSLNTDLGNLDHQQRLVNVLKLRAAAVGGGDDCPV